MSREIRLLDCTLRDGGYRNDWNFGSDVLTRIFDRLVDSGVDIIEIGFLDDRVKRNRNRTIQPTTGDFDATYSKTKGKGPMVLAMIDYGTCDMSNIQDKCDTFIDGIRLIFEKDDMHDAISFGREIIAKGYILFLQMVSITSYTEDDVIQFAEEVNGIDPYCVSIVDTYGLMQRDKAKDYYRILDKLLDPKIGIGYHSHNNLQLAYSNAVDVLEMRSKRRLILDGTLYGMGKRAGNAPIELLAMYLNENHGKDYRIDEMLEAIKDDILPMYEKDRWGYGLDYFVASKNHCHPSYIEFLSKYSTLSFKSMDEILSQIDDSKRLKYDEKLIKRLLKEYGS